jgi:hypothetical protein
VALVLKDRVKESTTTSGTGTLTLTGAQTGFQTFSSAVGNGNTTYYTIQATGSAIWEVGLGTVGAGTLSRDVVLSSSNSGALVTLPGTTFDVFCDYPAPKSVYQDASGNVGIGTTAPTTKLTLSSNTALPSAGAVTGTTFWNVGADSTLGNILIDSFSAGSGIIGRRAQGTSAAPSAVNSSNNLMRVLGYGYGTSSYSSNFRVSMDFQPDETWTDTAQGTKIQFLTTTNGTTTTTERMRIDNAGNVGIGTTSTPIKLSISGTDAMLVPVGTTAQRPTGAAGYFRYNSDLVSFEGYNGSAWSTLGNPTIQGTSPSSPVSGNLWWDTTYGETNIYYNDGTSSQWTYASAGQDGFQIDDLNGGLASTATFNSIIINCGGAT